MARWQIHITNTISLVYAFFVSKYYKIPLYGSRVKAGFPSPADDYLEQKLDLNEYLSKAPSCNLFCAGFGRFHEKRWHSSW